MENVDSNAILLNCLNMSCSALILILKCLLMFSNQNIKVKRFINLLSQMLTYSNIPMFKHLVGESSL